MKKLNLRFLIFSIIFSMYFYVNIFAKTGQKIPILTYHHLLPQELNKNFQDNSCVISVEEFEEQMAFLHDNGFYTLTQDELRSFLNEKKDLPSKSVMITFDDGYLSNTEYAYPILQKYNMKATIFIIGSLVAEEEQELNPNIVQYMSFKDMKETTDVFTFSHHTYDLHYEIVDETNNETPALLAVSKEQLIEDTTKNHWLLNNYAYAYPYGKTNDEVISTLSENGIYQAYTIAEKHVTKNTNPMQISRYTIYPNYSKSFKKIVTKYIF